jgi:hypothetical protein
MGSTKEAIETLSKALKEDSDYRMSWQANIAMAFQDEFERGAEFNTTPLTNVERDALHTVANKAADNFLNNLTRER